MGHTGNSMKIKLTNEMIKMIRAQIHRDEFHPANAGSKM